MLPRFEKNSVVSFLKDTIFISTTSGRIDDLLFGPDGDEIIVKTTVVVDSILEHFDVARPHVASPPRGTASSMKRRQPTSPGLSSIREELAKIASYARRICSGATVAKVLRTLSNGSRAARRISRDPQSGRDGCLGSTLPSTRSASHGELACNYPSFVKHAAIDGYQL